MRKTFFVIITILFISFLSLSIISYIVISSKIFNSIANLIEKMKYIASNPKKLPPLTKNTHGEILQVYTYFNQMIDSINNYQKELADLNEFFDKINIGLFWLNSIFYIKRCNETFLNLFNIDHAIGDFIEDILPLSFENLIFTNNKYEISSFIDSFSQKNYSINIYRTKHQNTIEYFGIINDITEDIRHEKIRKSLELELIRINKLSEVGKRIQGIVHNLNSPLNSIIRYAQLLSEDLELNENNNIEKDNLINDVKRIILNAKKMSKTIRILMYKTKDDSIAMPQQINLNEILLQELSFCQNDLFFKQNVKLKMSLAKDMPKIIIVYSDISQVFQTIFNNSIEAMLGRTNNLLEVSSFYDDNFIGFIVADNGVGIPEDKLNFIFETGYSTKSTTETSGFGIGLPLALSIIKKNKGNITVESNENIGTKIKVSLPR
jgi:signal transduction histidine kinase